VAGGTAVQGASAGRDILNVGSVGQLVVEAGTSARPPTAPPSIPRMMADMRAWLDLLRIRVRRETVSPVVSALATIAISVGVGALAWRMPVDRWTAVVIGSMPFLFMVLRISRVAEHQWVRWDQLSYLQRRLDEARARLPGELEEQEHQRELEALWMQCEKFKSKHDGG